MKKCVFFRLHQNILEAEIGFEQKSQSRSAKSYLEIDPLACQQKADSLSKA